MGSPPAASPIITAWVYTTGPLSLLPSEVVPTEAYMMKLRAGAADQFLDPSYQVRAGTSRGNTVLTQPGKQFLGEREREKTAHMGFKSK